MKGAKGIVQAGGLCQSKKCNMRRIPVDPP